MDQQVVFNDTTRVSFNNLQPEEIEYYVEHFQPYDKAGAYGIQEWIGAVGITNIEGSYKILQNLVECYKILQNLLNLAESRKIWQKLAESRKIILRSLDTESISSLVLISIQICSS